METTGLEKNKDRVISLGWVVIQNGSIKLNTASHILLKNGPIGEKTVGIHMITDEDITHKGRRPKSAIRYFRRLLRTRILVVHHAPIEIGFLQKLWKEHKISPLSFLILDTLAIERSYKNNTQQVMQQGDYRLPECRTRYGLPDYRGHDALTDALATAELFLAQIQHANSHSISDLMRLGGQTVTLKP